MALPTIIGAEGVTRLTLKTTQAVNIGDLIGHDGTDWVKARASTRIPAQFMAMQSVPAGSLVSVCRSGVLSNPADAPWTAGADQYLTTTAGTFGAIPAASATLTLLQRIGKALSTSEVSFDLARNSPDILQAQVTYDPASLATVTARNDTVTVTGLKTTDVIRGGSVVNAALEAGLVISMMDVSSADTLRIRLHNPTAGAIDGASLTHTILVERY